MPIMMRLLLAGVLTAILAGCATPGTGRKTAEVERIDSFVQQDDLILPFDSVWALSRPLHP